jgi:hypothetical protein
MTLNPSFSGSLHNCGNHFSLVPPAHVVLTHWQHVGYGCRSTDPAYIRSQKLDMLVAIATERNAVGILDELLYGGLGCCGPGWVRLNPC